MFQTVHLHVIIQFILTSDTYKIETEQKPDSYSKMERWAGKTAIVTGASAGIGAIVAVKLADHGMKVIVTLITLCYSIQITNHLGCGTGKKKGNGGRPQQKVVQQRWQNLRNKSRFKQRGRHTESFRMVQGQCWSCLHSYQQRRRLHPSWPDQRRHQILEGNDRRQLNE